MQLPWGISVLQKIANEYGDRAKKLNDVIKGLDLVFLDVASRKTIGLSLEDIKRHFESCNSTWCGSQQAWNQL